MIAIVVMSAIGVLWIGAARSTWTWLRDEGIFGGMFKSEPEQWGHAAFIGLCWLVLALTVPPLMMHLMTRPFVPLIWAKDAVVGKRMGRN